MNIVYGGEAVHVYVHEYRGHRSTMGVPSQVMPTLVLFWDRVSHYLRTCWLHQLVDQ